MRQSSERNPNDDWTYQMVWSKQDEEQVKNVHASETEKRQKSKKGTQEQEIMQFKDGKVKRDCFVMRKRHKNDTVKLQQNN